jgi:hypothetical protein
MAPRQEMDFAVIDPIMGATWNAIRDPRISSSR